MSRPLIRSTADRQFSGRTDSLSKKAIEQVKGEIGGESYDAYIGPEDEWNWGSGDNKLRDIFESYINYDTSKDSKKIIKIDNISNDYLKELFTGVDDEVYRKLLFGYEIFDGDETVYRDGYYMTMNLYGVNENIAGTTREVISGVVVGTFELEVDAETGDEMFVVNDFSINDAALATRISGTIEVGYNHWLNTSN